ncbi:MAG: hypothetical protein ABIP79_00115 [Chitinophagaceae bacterium]
MKKILLVCLFLFVTGNVFSQIERTQNWQKDIDFLITAIKNQHYVYKNKDFPEVLKKKIESLKINIASYSDERMLIELQRLMFYLGDGHSYFFPFGSKITESFYLPLQFYVFSDGMFVIDADSAYTSLIGMKVKKIGSATPKKMMKEMIGFISQDNKMGAKWVGPFYIRFRGLLESYGLPANSLDVTINFEGKNGSTYIEKVAFVPVPSLHGLPKMVSPKNSTIDKTPLYLSDVQTNFWLKELPEHKAIYFQFNQVRNAENESLLEFSKRLEGQLAQKKPTLLIVDVRHNNGGNGDLTPPLINVIKDFEGNQSGKIIVITGRNTFSAAQIFISKIDKETDAIFVGESSSSKPNFVGEENMVLLPYSGAMGSISNRYHENIPNDKRQFIKPNIKIELSSKDFFNNHDPVLKAILNGYDY